MQIDIEKLNERLIETVSNDLFETYHDGWRDAIRKRVDEKVNELIAAEAGRLLQAAVEKAVSDGFNAAFTPVDGFGKPAGQPTTIAKTLEQMAGDYWTTLVDPKGVPLKSGDYAYGKAVTRAEYFLAKMAADDFANVIGQPEAIAAVARVKEALRTEMRSRIDALLAEIVHVRTETDKKEGRVK